MSTPDNITPGAIYRLLQRLQEDHQRIYPHHARLCPLCQDTELAIELLAEQLPDDEIALQQAHQPQ